MFMAGREMDLCQRNKENLCKANAVRVQMKSLLSESAQEGMDQVLAGDNVDVRGVYLTSDFKTERDNFENSSIPNSTVHHFSFVILF